MRNLRSTSIRRWAKVFAVVPLVWLAVGCERQGGNEASPAGDSFVLPEVDVSALPDGLQFRVQSLREAIRQSPKNPDQVANLGALYYVQGYPQAAAVCLVRARELAPESVNWWYYSALALERVQERQPAIAAYERALELDANYPPLYVRLGRLLVESDAQRATSLCQRALELDPEDPTATFTLGLCAEAGGDLNGARARFEDALEKAPDYREAHEAMARVLTGLNRAEEAGQHQAAAAKGKTPLHNDPLFEVLLRNGCNGEILIRDTLILAQRGLFEQADRALAMLADADRTGLATHRTTGLVRSMQGRLEEAAERFRLVLDARPDAWDVRAELADVLARMNKTDEAEAEFRAVLEQQPDARYGLEPLSRLLLVLGRAEDAVQLLSAAAQRQPDQAWIRLLLGDALASQNKDDEARAQYQACLELVPGHVGARYSLGALAQRAGDLAAAKREWQQILETTPDFVDAHAALADVALQERDFAAAERYMRAGFEQAPEYPRLMNGLAWILATSPDEKQRQGAEAVKLAERACEMTENRQHALLDTLAAAYAEVGRFDDAAKTIGEAIRLASEAGMEAAAADYRQRLALYEQKQPYREPQ